MQMIFTHFQSNRNTEFHFHQPNMPCYRRKYSPGFHASLSFNQANNFEFLKLNFTYSILHSNASIYEQIETLSLQNSTYVILVVLNSQYCMVNHIFPDLSYNRWTPCRRGRVFPSSDHRCSCNHQQHQQQHQHNQ